MNQTRYLIVNADDFGLSDGVNRGIIQAHEHGVVTSASLMVRWPAAGTAAAYARERGELDLGVHLDLGEWVYRDGEWAALYDVVPAEDETLMRDEVRRQLDAFQSLMGAPPTHIDSHQHVHRQQPLRGIVRAFARDLGVPVRHFTPSIQYCGEFYGQTGKGEPHHDAVSQEALVRVLRSLPIGVSELCCHPGYDDDLDTMYRLERRLEVEALCDPVVRETLVKENIELLTFGILPTDA
jgi:chitin disaccharide deacetylase